MTSLHYELSVNGISTSITKKLNSMATRFVKSWLGLCGSTTVAVIHHPSVLNIPTLESYSTSAKISYLAAVTVSPDPMIQEISHIALSSNFGLAHEIPDMAREALIVATESIESINRKTLPRTARTFQVQAREEKWNSSLENYRSKGSSVMPAPSRRKIGYGIVLWTRCHQVNCRFFCELHLTPFPHL